MHANSIESYMVTIIARINGRYHNRVPGLLDGIKHIRYINSIIIVRKEDSEKIIKLIKEYNADVHTWEVKLSESDANLLA